MKNGINLTLAAVVLAALAQASDPSMAPKAWEERIANERARTIPPEKHAAAANTNPYGAPYGVWGSRWWQWVYSLPVGNPVTHPQLTTGAVDCSIGQSGDVWFLAGNITGGSTVRSCTIPSGKALFFPVLNSWCDNVGIDAPTNFPLSQLQGCAAWFVDPSAGLHVNVDGTPMTISQANRGQAAFSYRLPNQDNFLNVVYGAQVPGPGWPTGNTPNGVVVAPVAADGYWLLLEPLAPGVHTINFGGTSVNSGYSLDVTYTITVL